MRINSSPSPVTTQGGLHHSSRSPSGDTEKLSSALRIKRHNADAVVLSNAGTQQAQGESIAETRRQSEMRHTDRESEKGSLTDLSAVLEKMRKLAISAPKPEIPVTEPRDETATAQSEIRELTSRLINSASNLLVSEANHQAAESQIRDADFASESSQNARNLILSNSAAALLAQTNGNTESVLARMGQ